MQQSVEALLGQPHVPDPNIQLGLLHGNDLQAARSWRSCSGGRRVRPGGCEGCEIAFVRLIIGRIIGRNEVVLSDRRRSDVETRHRSHCGENRRHA